MAALEVDNISVHYGAVQAVDRVTLRVQAGEVHAVLGASGAGKTTLMRAIAGFEPISDGRIRIHGREVSGTVEVPPEKRGVGVVFQDYALFPHLTVAENVGYPLGRRPDAAVITSLLRQVGLDGMQTRRPSELSGGEQQRVALARALAQRPDLLLLDEPFAHLDPSRRAEIRAETLRVVRDAGVAAILVTHAAEDALSVADVVHVVHGGRLRQSAAPRAIYETPVDAIVARSVGPVQLVPCTVERGVARTVLGEVPVASGEGDWLLVRPEAITLDAPDGVPATVVRKAFQGADVDVTLRVGDVELVAKTRPWLAPTSSEVRVQVTRACAVVSQEGC